MRERSRRLLLPLLFGMAVVVVPQAYYELKTQAPELLPGNGGYLDFWAAYLRLEQFCKGDDCLDVPTWNHLWFLPYLWLYALVAVVLAGWRRGVHHLGQFGGSPLDFTLKVGVLVLQKVACALEHDVVVHAREQQ